MRYTACNMEFYHRAYGAIFMETSGQKKQMQGAVEKKKKPIELNTA